MKDSEELFQLIKSLSGPEKRYLKLISSVYEGDKNYLDVFNILVKQKNYNEQSFRKKIKNKTILKQLPRIKNYLYEFILKSISSYHADNSERSRLNNDMEQITLLISRGLIKHSRKLISRSKKRAYLTGNYSTLIEILKSERMISRRRLELEKVKDINMEMDEVWNHLQVSHSYEKLSDAMFVLIAQEGRARTDETIQQAKKILEDPLLSDETKAINYFSKLLYYLIHSHYAQLEGNVQSSYQNAKAMLNLVESQPFRLIEDQTNYISILNNLMNFTIESKKYDEVPGLLEKLRTIRPKNINNEVLQFYLSYIVEQDFFLKTGEFEKGVLLEKKIKERMETYGEKIPATIQYIFLINFSLLNFGAGNYSKCLKFLNEAMGMTNAEQNKYIQVYLKIFNLIVHFELGNEDLLPYLLRSTYRYLLKQQRIYKYENFMLQFIRKLPKTPSTHKTKESFIELRSNLKELEQDPFEKHALGNFDIISWLESKIEKRSFSEIVKEKK